MNAIIRPMLATLGKPPTRFDGWAVEAKYDGQRGMAVVDGGTVKLWSRNGADITRTFPEIVTALGSGNRRFILDGEIVALDESGAPSFSRLQRRWSQNRRPTAELLRAVPVRFYLFDVLEADGRDLTRKPYTTRRLQLADLNDHYASSHVDGFCSENPHPHVSYSRWWPSSDRL